ncbi:TraR/DksA C4-type zinc finger protein [Patescibacteria group bacterium]|nr:TraR/DksA C4-type zinc finger protein [Patescibacteria group bacterium]
MISVAQVAEFKKTLDGERAVLEAELQKIGVRDPSNPSDWVAAKNKDDSFGADRNDNADIFEEMQDANATISELEVRFDEVNRALKKIEEGTYGICEISGTEIEEDRLLANPAARTCKAHMNQPLR